MGGILPPEEGGILPPMGGILPPEEGGILPPMGGILPPVTLILPLKSRSYDSLKYSIILLRNNN
jgi:hypothetical protein